MSENGHRRRREVWIGHDHRQPLSYNVMRYSVESNASKPVPVNGLFINQLPMSRQGATEFTFSRFLVPYLMDYEGIGIFCDEDQAVTGDIWELFAYASKLKDWDVAVMKDQERFEWPSVMIFNNANCTTLTPEFVDDEENTLFDFAWTKEERIESFPEIWNHCCGMKPPREDAKLYHWTQGIPYWTECRGLREDEIWFQAYQTMLKSVEWIELHHDTWHFKPVMARFLANYGLKIS